MPENTEDNDTRPTRSTEPDLDFRTRLTASRDVSEYKRANRSLHIIADLANDLLFELLLHFEEFLRFFLLHAVQRHPGPLLGVAIATGRLWNAFHNLESSRSPLLRA